MILPKPEDAIHKMQLCRLLTEILDEPAIAQQVCFKGGTCATMLGFLDRFSLDLDFDLADKAKKKIIEQKLQQIFKKLDFQVKQKSLKELFYVLKYQSPERMRNTLKLSLLPKTVKANVYLPFYLKEIDRYAICQTIETMFAHKLVSPTDRFKKHQMIAGRDIYDIHHFFLQGYRYSQKVIEERTGKNTLSYLKELKKFVEEKINEKTLFQELNYLLPYEKFKKIRKILKKETIMLLTDEIKRLLSPKSVTYTPE